ncbi:DUF6492 family protein [Kaistia adipata]|uniref:DUF6492 family protein n=1 Tax=Kaistia adipata TaxID=166954 RepID=UPI0003FB6506|nr:DUF6492 family protein [Kaistia adipata]
MSRPEPEANLITCSFRGDLDVCRMLCESIDRFVPETIPHSLYVPRADIPLFADLASPRRTIGAQEDLLPRWFIKLPLPSPEWRRRLHLPRRNMYVTPYSPLVRGWIAQQIMKIAATARAVSEITVHVDSDNAFIRPLTLEHLTRDGKVRLYRNPERVELETHRVWQEVAGRLLGLPPSRYYGAEYIDQLVVWRRSVIRRMTARIEEISGRDWRVTLARTPHFAEYVLHGVYADQVLGLEEAGLMAEDFSLSHARWSDEFDGAAGVQAFIDALRPEHVASLIQSTMSTSMAERQAIFERLAARAAAQDQEAGRLAPSASR